jgi:hypothetical protein
VVAAQSGPRVDTGGASPGGAAPAKPEPKTN